jgi:dTMP kinase
VDAAAREAYLNWLWDLEFVKFRLPVPDCVLFLDMPPVYSRQLLLSRPGKSGEVTTDIHERDGKYLTDCYHNATAIAVRYGWQIIPCVNREGIRDIAAIHADIFTVVSRILG